MSRYQTAKTKYLPIIGVVMLMFCMPASHANTNDVIHALQASSALELSGVSGDEIAALKTSSAKNQADYKPLIDKLMQQATSNVPQKQHLQPVPNAILFVSFSMPKSLLFALADEAADFNMPVVIRGLVQNDFKKTIATFERLHREAKKQHLKFNGVSIDPVWFQQFNITSVPALVVSLRPETCETATVCPNLPFDVVYGNAHLKKGLELIVARGDAAPMTAKHILEQGHV
jgi:conjugal transfer pilus assembly protein TrbC